MIWKMMDGTWVLHVNDDAGSDTGNLNEWCLILADGGGPGASEVPTMSTWGLIAFISLAAIAAIVIRRHPLI